MYKHIDYAIFFTIVRNISYQTRMIAKGEALLPAYNSIESLGHKGSSATEYCTDERIMSISQVMYKNQDSR